MMSGIEEKQLVIFSLGTEEFGVEIENVREINRMQDITPIPKAPEYVRGIINIRGSVLVIIDLRKKLNFVCNDNHNTRILNVEFKNSSAGMVVDSAYEVMKLNLKDIKPAPKVIVEKLGSTFISGVGIIGSRMITLIDIGKIFGEKELNIVQSIAESQHNENKAGNPPPQQMVVTQKSSEQKPIEKIAEQKNIEQAPIEKVVEQKPAELKIDHPVLNDVDEFHFVTHEGMQIKNVSGLLEYIKGLDDERFRNFVNEEKNDFYNWILHVIKDQELADKIQHLKSKNDVTKEIMKRLLEVIK